jgi:DNA end-binding protein Ku
LAATLIEKKTGEFDPSEFHNRYVDALKGLIKEKQRKKGEKVIQDPDADAPPSRGSNVIDLMAALKKSLGDSGGANDNKGAKKPAAKKAPAKKAPAPAKKTAQRKRA